MTTKQLETRYIALRARQAQAEYNVKQSALMADAYMGFELKKMKVELAELKKATRKAQRELDKQLMAEAV